MAQNVNDLTDYLNQIPPEARANMVREYLFDAWNEGLDFGTTVKFGTTRAEAIQQNPYTKPTPHELEQQRLAAAWDAGHKAAEDAAHWGDGGPSNPYRP